MSDIDFDHFLQESMSQHKSRFLEFEASVGEIQDNMKSILGKVILKIIVWGTMVRFNVWSQDQRQYPVFQYSLMYHSVGL